MTIEKKNRITLLGYEAMAKIKAGFENPVNMLEFLFDCNSSLLMKTYSENTKQIVSPEEYAEIYENLWFCNCIQNRIAVPWIKNELDTEDQMYNAIGGLFDPLDYKSDVYLKRVSGLMEALVANVFNTATDSFTYSQAFRALFEADYTLKTIEQERLLETPKLTQEQLREKANQILCGPK